MDNLYKLGISEVVWDGSNTSFDCPNYIVRFIAIYDLGEGKLPHYDTKGQASYISDIAIIHPEYRILNGAVYFLDTPPNNARWVIVYEHNIRGWDEFKIATDS